MSDDDYPDDLGVPDAEPGSEAPEDLEAVSDPELASEGEEAAPPAESEGEEGLDLDAGHEAAGSEVETDSEAEAPAAAQPRKADPRRAGPARPDSAPRWAVVVPDEERQTSNRLLPPELACLVAMRAQELASYPTQMSEDQPSRDPVDIALAEVYARQTPYILRRQVGYAANGQTIYEEWPVRQMVLPDIALPRR
jgi:hypothetical protein